MFREVGSARQRTRLGLKRWFQDDYFDLFVTCDAEDTPQWFQLCYERDSPRERVLEWRRGIGFQHLRLRGGESSKRKDAGELVADGLMPYLDVMAHFEAAAQGLPQALAAFVGAKVRDYARPPRRFPRPRREPPRWLERQRRRARTL